jgi:hypothetical protein
MFVKAHRVVKIAAELAVKRQLALADRATFELVQDREFGEMVGPDEVSDEVM